MLQRMRRSTVWFVIAALWFLLTAMHVFQHHAGLAALTAGVALVFVSIGILLRRRELAKRQSARPKP